MTPINEEKAGAEYAFIPDLNVLLSEVPPDSIVSRTIFSGDRLKGTLFGFAAGQELSEHTAARPAILHFLSGEAQLVLGEDSFNVQSGTWVHMPAHLPHSIEARTPVVMLLLLLD